MRLHLMINIFFIFLLFLLHIFLLKKKTTTKTTNNYFVTNKTSQIKLQFKKRHVILFETVQVFRQVLCQMHF